MYTPPRNEVDGDAYAHRLRAMSKVRKLLRLAEDQAGQPEGELARGLADALLKEHGLSRAQVELGGDEFKHRAMALGAAAAWRRTLVHVIADYFDCVALFEREAEEAQTFGPDHLLPHVEYAFVVYMNQLRRAWKAHAGGLEEDGTWGRLSRAQQVEAREAFATSFVIGVRERLEADRRKERQEDPVGAGAMSERRRSLDRWMRSGGVRWRQGFSGVHGFDAEGYRAGLEAEVEAALGAKERRRIPSGDQGA